MGIAVLPSTISWYFTGLGKVLLWKKKKKQNLRLRQSEKTKAGILFSYSWNSKVLYSPSKGELEGTVNSHENREIAYNQKLIFEQVCDISSYYVVSPKTLQARNLDMCFSCRSTFKTCGRTR